MAKLSYKRSFRLLWNLPKSIPFGIKLLKDKRVAKKNKIIFLTITLGYLFFPYDFVLDIPFIGQFDDFAVFMLMFNWFVNKVPRSILQEYKWPVGQM